MHYDLIAATAFVIIYSRLVFRDTTTTAILAVGVLVFYIKINNIAHWDILAPIIIISMGLFWFSKYLDIIQLRCKCGTQPTHGIETKPLLISKAIAEATLYSSFFNVLVQAYR